MLRRKKPITRSRAAVDPVFAQPTSTPDPTNSRDPVTDQKLKEVGTVEPFPVPRGGRPAEDGGTTKTPDDAFTLNLKTRAIT